MLQHGRPVVQNIYWSGTIPLITVIVGVWKQMGLPLSCGDKVLARALRQNQLVLKSVATFWACSCAVGPLAKLPKRLVNRWCKQCKSGLWTAVYSSPILQNVPLRIFLPMFVVLCFSNNVTILILSIFDVFLKREPASWAAL